jgi:hypothetical protein
MLTVKVHRAKRSSMCRSCGAAITWRTTVPNNKPMPFTGDPEPVEQTRYCDVMSAADSHWATCPQAKQWKRKGGRDDGTARPVHAEHPGV